MKQEDLKEVLNKHKLWLEGKEGGERANLRYADLRGANLRGANLRYADISYANLRYADLSYANLRGVNLSYANLRYADLSYANLRGVNLSGADLPNFLLNPLGGAFEAYKATKENVLHILIPKEAKRINSLVGRKCRASEIVVLEILDRQGNTLTDEKSLKVVNGWRTESFQYEVGQTVYPDHFNDDIRLECTNGIHFFVTKKEAVDWLN